MILIIQSAILTFLDKQDDKEEILTKQEGDWIGNLIKIRHLFISFNIPGLLPYFYL